MGLFDRLQDEIDARGRQEGLSPIDMLDLPPGLAAIAKKIVRRNGMNLAEIATDVSLDPAGQVLRVRALNAVGRLAGILEALTAAGLKPGEVNLRANTLEDVFIQLTGRRLRE